MLPEISIVLLSSTGYPQKLYGCSYKPMSSTNISAIGDMFIFADAPIWILIGGLVVGVGYCAGRISSPLEGI